MKKIFYVTTVELMLRSFFLKYAKAFRAEGYEVRGVARDAETSELCIEAFSKLHNVQFSRSPKSPENLTALFAFRKLILEEQPDLVHLHSTIASVLARFAIATIPKKKRPIVVFTAHGFHFIKGQSFLKYQVLKWFEKLASPWSDWYLVMNQSDHKTALDLKLTTEDRLRFIHGVGVELPDELLSLAEKKKYKEKLCAELNLPVDSFLILKAAFFDPEKRHEDLINALNHAKSKNIHLLFAGSGRLEQEIRAICKDLNLENRIHFLGYRKDVPDLLKAVDAGAMATLREGLPRFLLEGMSLGTPLIGTRIRGVTDLLGDNCGLIVDTRNPKQMGAAMDRLSENESFRIELRENAWEKVQKYELSKVIQFHLDLYEEILNSEKNKSIKV